MGFWIEYGYAIKGEKKELRKIQKRFNRGIKRDNQSLNGFRRRIGIEPGGKGDWIAPTCIRKDILYLWTYVRCNWMDPIDFCYKLRNKVGKEPKIFFIVNESDLDPGRADEMEIITNDKDGTAFHFDNPKFIVDDII